MCDTIGDPTRCEGLIVVVLFLFLLLEEDVSMWSIFEIFEFKFFEVLMGLKLPIFSIFVSSVISSYR